MGDEGEDDPLTEQVVVAALPGHVPEVHLATLNRSSATVSLRKACVRAGGDLSLGAEKSVSLAAAGSVVISNGVVAVLGHDGGLLVQLHPDTPEEQRAWAEGIQSALPGGGHGAGAGQARRTDGPEEEEDTDEDAVLLQARSRQLQNRIGALEAAGDRQDRKVQKVLRRLDGAMQMLEAVQEMCTQQRKVIAAQKDAIAELRVECGEEGQGPAEEGGAEPGDQRAAGASGDRRSGRGGAQDDDREAKAEEMLKLLQQTDQMSRALAAMQSPTALPQAPAESPDTAGAARRPGGGRPAKQPADGAREDAGEEGDEVVLARLMQLQAEKRRFEGMLRDSQQEHEDLLHRLEGMQTLMRDMGMPDPVDNSSAD